MTDKPKITAAHHDAARRNIERLIASPPVRVHRTDDQAFPASAAINSPEAKRAVDSLRRKLAADHGLTLEQWLEMEAAVSHPREVVSVALTPAMIARRRMKAAGVPEKYIRDVADKRPLECEPFRHVQEFLESRDAFRVLSGGVGVRKTGSACYALGQLDGGAFVHAQEVTRLSITDRPKWEAIISAPIVVFDDLGTEQGDQKGAFKSAFCELINRVYGSASRLVLTCNLSPQTFKAEYGAREYDRVREMGKWSSIAGVSVRSYHEPEDRT